MKSSREKTDKDKIARLEKKVKDLMNEISDIKNSKKRKNLEMLNDQFSEEINLKKLKEEK
ncbi:hypothetical protein N9U79_00125 [Alphaproteobacteria bacterium]|jgi:hypothetical protein|nr:hypothetical protein [Alphaproteobacteria bacterium]|tara:strand:+ start:1920 stop:2099 length:180 start_codon:yes stop_codon:yes gene_type:complete